MARSVTKVKPIPAAKPVNRPALIDEYGRLQLRLAEVRAMVRRSEQLKEIILEWYASEPAEASFDEDGREYSIHVGPRARRRAITDMRALLTKLGSETFLGICSVSLEKLDRVIVPAEQGGLVRDERTGNRTLRAVAKFLETAA